MKKDGFTIVELLATILVLAVIIGLAIPGYNTINSSVRKRHRENLIKEIEIAASSYAFDSGETLFFVNDLITEGYYKGDNNDEVIDPVSNMSLNCYAISVEKIKDSYKATFIDSKDYTISGNVCNVNDLKKDSNKLSIVSSSTQINGWYKGNVNLNISSNVDNFVINCAEPNKCTWTSTSGIRKSVLDNNLSISVDNVKTILNTKYIFEYITYENDNVNKYTASTDLKIDNEAPIIYSAEISISDRYTDTISKYVTISASDGSGSGIKSYYLGKYTGSNCSTIDDSKYTNSKTFEVSSATGGNGTYQICVKDNVGNVASYNSLEINHLT